MASPAPPTFDYSDDGPAIIISCGVLAVLATITVAVRFWARKLSSFGYGMDDWLALAALIFHHGAYGSSIGIVKYGLGRDINLLMATEPGMLVGLYKSMFIGELFYGFSASLAKLSVLAFYWRVFPTQNVKVGCMVLASLCFGWTISIQIVNLLQCRPLEAFWNLELRELPGTVCLDVLLYFIGNSSANCVIDFLTLILPVREVLRLNMTTRRKFGVLGIFLLSGIAFAASMTRTISIGVVWTLGVTNFTKQFSTGCAASNIEIYVAIIGACLPTMVPVYKRVRHGSSFNSKLTPTSNTAASGVKTIGKIASRKPPDKGFERLNEEELNPSEYYSNHQVNVSSWGERHAQRDSTMDIPLEGIVVKQDMTVSETLATTKP